jgi:hypothetical protein
MARPKKQIVDYFPHSCTSGKTLFILEQEFGNDGYAFWFKLLELLGTTPGHCVNYKDVASRRFIVAKTRVSVEKTELILQLLAELDAIDKELWAEGKIWSQNFVDNIYTHSGFRRSETPQKPSIYNKNSDNDELLQQKPQLDDVNHCIGSINPDLTTQTKRKESKVKENQIERVDEIIKQLEKNFNIKVALTEKNHYMFLVVEMARLFTDAVPEYFFDRDTDYSACLEIAYNIAKMKKWSKAEVLNGKMNETLESWKVIIAFVKEDKWLNTRSLSDLSTPKEWQRLVLKMKNPKNSGTDKQSASSVGRTIENDLP